MADAISPKGRKNTSNVIVGYSATVTTDHGSRLLHHAPDAGDRHR
jgi:hypothetical protein